MVLNLRVTKGKGRKRFTGQSSELGDNHVVITGSAKRTETRPRLAGNRAESGLCTHVITTEAVGTSRSERSTCLSQKPVNAFLIRLREMISIIDTTFSG